MTTSAIRMDLRLWRTTLRRLHMSGLSYDQQWRLSSFYI